MPDYFWRVRRAQIVWENIWFSADQKWNSIRFFLTNWSPALPPKESILCCRILEMQLHFPSEDNHPRTPSGVAQCWNSSMSPSISTSSPASHAMPFCLCSLTFWPSSHSRGLNGKFARFAGLFLLQINGLNRKLFCDHRGTGSLGLHHQSRRAPTLSLTLLQASSSPVPERMPPSTGEHAPDGPKREI